MRKVVGFIVLENPYRLIKTVDVLTRPTPARRDAPFTVRGRRREITRGVPFSPAQPRAAEQLLPRGYVEDYFDTRTTLGAAFISLL